jgi:hypothetical protein
LVEGEGRAGRFPRFESGEGENLERNLAVVDAVKTIADTKGCHHRADRHRGVFFRGHDIRTLVGARWPDRLA